MLFRPRASPCVYITSKTNAIYPYHLLGSVARAEAAAAGNEGMPPPPLPLLLLLCSAPGCFCPLSTSVDPDDRNRAAPRVFSVRRNRYLPPS